MSFSLYIKQQITALLVNTSSAVKFICIVTICGYIISYSEIAVQALSVTPGYLLPPSFWIWTAFTFCFLELHFWEVLIDIITVGLCGKLIEPLWGQMEMMTFFAITNLGCACLTTLYYLFVYMCTKNTELLFDVHIHGLAGYIAGVSVAVRQIIPDLILIKTPLGRIKNRNIPLLVVIASLILWACGVLDGTFPAMFTSGLIISWIYLRFYQRHSSNSRGDSSDSFTFASFFPNVTQPVISILVNPIYLCSLRIGLIKPFAQISRSPSQLTSISVTMPGVDVHDAERRRQIAIKALSERLSKTTKDNKNQLPKSFSPIIKNPNEHQHSHQHQHNQHHQHQHHQHLNHPHQQHAHSHNHGHHGPHQFINPTMTPFTIPAIPLPPPPQPQQTTVPAVSTSLSQSPTTATTSTSQVTSIDPSANHSLINFDVETSINKTNSSN